MTGVSHRYALGQAKRAFHGRVVKSHGFEEREVAGVTINVLYYTVDYQEGSSSWQDIRADVYSNGKPTSGISFK